MRQPKTIRHHIPTCAFVVEGETEVWYLQMFKQHEQRDRNLRVNIKPEIPQKKKIKDQYKLVRELARSEYDRVFWIVDLDVIIKETREAPKEKLPPLNEFMELRRRLHDEFDNVQVIVNNPCLEFWFLLHFVKTNEYYKNYQEVLIELREYLRGYDKTRRYFMKANKDIYARLKPYLEHAIENAGELGNFDEKNPLKALSEMDELFRTEALQTAFGKRAEIVS